MKGVLLLGILLSLGLAQETSLVETSSTSQIIRLQEQGLGPQNEVPLAREEDESEFELFSRFMELEAEARPGPKKESRAPRKAVDPLRPKARKLARKLVRDLKKGLQNNFFKNFEQAAADHTKDFATHLFAKCRGYAITPALCNNLLVVYRESFNKQNPFSQKNRPRFRAAIAEIHMKFIRAWRLAQSQPKGNPFASVPDGVDPFKGLRLRTDVNGHLNRFGKVNAPNEVSAKELKRAGILSDGSENKNGNGVWMADRAIKELATRLRKDLRSLRTEVVRVFGKGKFAPAILAKGTRRQAAERVVKICRNLKQQIDLAPTFCKSVGFLMQVNFVGRNPLAPKSIDKFGSVLASFMQHNHRHAVRGGDIKVARRPSYAQDTIAITVNLKLRVTPNRFNLRSLAKEYVNVLSSILRVPEQRLRVTAVSLPRVRITFEILPAKNDKVRESNPNSPDSVDALALMFRGMAKDKTSDFYKSPILCRVLPRSVVVSKLLGVGFYKAKAIRKMKIKAAGKPPASAKPRFAEDLGEASSNVQVLQQALQAINQEEQNEDTLTEEEEEQLATEYDQETDAVENPEAMPSEESEEATTSASFLEAVSSADEESDAADMTEFDVDVPSDSEAERATDPWLVFLSTRSDEFLTAEQEGDAEDTDEAEEADEEEEELAKEAAEDSMFDEEIPAGAFIEEEEEEVSEEATEQQEEEEEEEDTATAAVEVAAKTAAEPTVLLETDVMIEKAINNGLQQIATGAASSVSTSVFALLCSMCLALMMAL